MTLRSEITFSSDFPDDAIYDDDQCVEVQPGRNIAEALKAALEPLDYRVSEPIDGGDHGWELDIWRGRKRLWLQISLIDDCIIIAKPVGLWPDMKLFRAFLSDLQRILEADSRVNRIGWYPKGGIAGDAAPATRPFDD